jgi:hypothetical protein
MHLKSDAFKEGQPIPSRYTCDGYDDRVPLRLGDAPSNTVSLALVVSDADAPSGTWYHWVVFNLPPDTRQLEHTLPSGAVEGVASNGKRGWHGPCPPEGSHRYVWDLYALDTMLDLSSPNAPKLIDAMRGHIIQQASLAGTYQRS